MIPYGLPLPDDDEAPESQAPAGPDVAASAVLPQGYSESRDEKAKTEKKQSKYFFIGFFIGFFVVIFFFVKLVMIYVTVIKDMDKEVIEEPSENKMVSQTWEDDTKYYGHVHNGLPDGLGIATQVDGTVYNG